MKSPVVLEGDVGVVVVSPFKREAVGCPPLPPVVVQLEAIIKEARLAIEEAHPCAPRLLVGAAQIAEVVDLEAGRAARKCGLEHQMLTRDLAEPDFFGVTAERGTAAVQWKIGIRSLIKVHAVVLQRGDHSGRTAHQAVIEIARNLVRVLEEAVAEIDRADVRAGREIR